MDSNRYIISVNKTPEMQPQKIEDDPASCEKLFMKPRQFAEYIGLPYLKVLKWIKRGMPVMPDSINPYYIIVPAAKEWIKEKYRF